MPRRAQEARKEVREYQAEQQAMTELRAALNNRATAMAKIKTMVGELRQGEQPSAAQDAAFRPLVAAVLGHVAELEQLVLEIFRRNSRAYGGRQSDHPERKLTQLLGGPLGEAVALLVRYDRAAQDTAGSRSKLEMLEALRKQQCAMLNDIRLNLEESSHAHDLLS